MLPEKSFFANHILLIIAQYTILVALWQVSFFIFDNPADGPKLTILLTCLLVFPYYKIYSKHLKSMGLSVVWFFVALVFYIASLLVSLPLFGLLVDSFSNPVFFENGEKFKIFLTMLPGIFMIHMGSVILLGVFSIISVKPGKFGQVRRYI